MYVIIRLTKMQVFYKEKVKKMKKIIPLIIIVVAVIIIAISCSAGDDEDKSPTSDTNTTTTEESTEPEMTTAQANAYEAAKNYVDTMAFSRKGLIQQLTSEYGDNYKKKDAVFAVNLLQKNKEVNWKDEAEEAARAYLDTQTFSEEGLFEQLTSEYGDQFTEKQARYAVNKVYN